MTRAKPRAGYLHVQGQMHWHDDLMIAGDRAGLEILRDTIDQAISEGRVVNEGFDLFQNDGEGYALLVACLPDDQMQTISSAYHDAEIFNLADQGDNAMWRIWVDEPPEGGEA